MHPIIFEIGPIRIASYGVMLAVGFLAGLTLLKREMARKGLDATLGDRMFVAAMLGGIVGGKAFHLLENPDLVATDPVGSIFSGYGLAFYGGFIGGAAAVFWTLHRHGGLNLQVLDAVAPSLAVGYFFGRGGCQLSGDGCYGVSTVLPWGMAYPNGTVPTLVPVHPTPLYEMLEMALLFGLLWSLRTRIRTPGILFCIYLILAGAFRFAVEFVRRTPEVAFGLTVHQWIGLALILFGAVCVVWLHRRASETALKEQGVP